MTHDPRSDHDRLGTDERRPPFARSASYRFAARAGFDPRPLATPSRWFRIRPRRIQAWREANELPGRELMRGGGWLV